METICILNRHTNKCINKIVVQAGTWKDHAEFVRAPRDDGEIGWTLLDDGEWDYVEPTVTLEQRQDYARARRDKFLSLYVDAMNAVRWASMSAEQQQVWSDYRQALLDVPDQAGFPDDIVWPVRPE